MKHPGLYNPCKDGFVAKAWECLRRNAEFENTVRLFGARSEDDAEYAIARIWDSPPNHPFLRRAVAYCLGGDPEVPGLLEEYEHVSAASPWSGMNARLQANLEGCLNREGAYRFELPNIKEVGPLAKGGVSDDASRAFFSELEFTALTHDLIAVPKVVWDSQHTKTILGEITELLRKPRAGVKWLKPTGRTLGTPKQWESFLLWEEWRLLGFNRNEACRLVALEVDAGETLGPSLSDSNREALSAWRNTRKKCGAAALSKRFSAPKRGATVERDRVARIEAAIRSVFPRFLPLEQ